MRFAGARHPAPPHVTRRMPPPAIDAIRTAMEEKLQAALSDDADIANVMTLLSELQESRQHTRVHDIAHFLGMTAPAPARSSASLASALLTEVRQFPELAVVPGTPLPTDRKDDPDMEAGELALSDVELKAARSGYAALGSGGLPRVYVVGGAPRSAQERGAKVELALNIPSGSVVFSGIRDFTPARHSIVILATQVSGDADRAPVESKTRRSESTLLMVTRPTVSQIVRAFMAHAPR